ncbi:MAG: DNA polymerase III subunit delta' [Bacteroidaceae bacterium]|nr:DNA polymerase III subunit delta' [Bacteroidaceae bacterium]
MFGFKDVIGQEALKEKLRREVDEGHIPHAQLFCGPSGVGKLALALAYARYLCCTNRSDGEACGHCQSCKQWDQLMHPDVHFMFPIVSSEKKKKTICADYLTEWRELLINSPYFSYSQWLEAIDAENSQALIYGKESDEITKTLSLKPVQGDFKITIIWLPEKMNETCANKMLKLLEEPPERTIFLLCSEEPERMLSTILSRAQRINLPRLTEIEIAKALQNKYGIEPRDSENLAHLANGSFVKALDQIHLNEDNDRYLELFISLMRLAYARRIREMKAWSEEVASLGREKQKELLTYCQRMIRESFMANFHQKQMSYMNLEEQNFTSRFAPFVNEGNAMGIMQELSEAQIHIEQNVNAKMVFFDLALKMIVLLIKK